MIYLAVTLLLLALVRAYDYGGAERGRRAWWCALCLAMVCIAGFRYKMGIDSIKYENYYSWLHPIQEIDRSDFRHTRFSPLYIVLCSVCRAVSGEFMLLQFVVAAIINVSVFRFLWRGTRHVFFAALLYWFFLFLNLNMEVLREALAVSVFLWAWPFFKSGKWWVWYLLSLLAFGFHVSAAIMFLLPLLWLPGVRVLFRWGPQTAVMCLLSVVLAFGLNHWLFEFVRLVAVTENMAERALVYSRTSLSGSTLNLWGALGHVVRFAAYPLVALWFLNRSADGGKRRSESWLKTELMTLTGVFLALATLGITILQRYNNYFLFFSFVTVADWAFTVFKEGERKIRLRFLYWTLLFLPLFAMQATSWFTGMNPSGTIKTYMMYHPYSNQFDREIAPARRRAIRYSRRL